MTSTRTQGQGEGERDDYFARMEWVPTLYEGIETAWSENDRAFLSRWSRGNGLLHWVMSDGETREQAVKRLVEMAPDIMLCLHAGEDEALQKLRALSREPEGERERFDRQMTQLVGPPGTQDAGVRRAERDVREVLESVRAHVVRGPERRVVIDPRRVGRYESRSGVDRRHPETCSECGEPVASECCPFCRRHQGEKPAEGTGLRSSGPLGREIHDASAGTPGVEERERVSAILFNELIFYESGGCCGPLTSTQEVEEICDELADRILAALNRSAPRVEKDDEGRPYQCGAFVAGDSRWECCLESDHASDHEWRLRADPSASVEPDVIRVRLLTGAGNPPRGSVNIVRAADGPGEWSGEVLAPPTDREGAHGT